LDHTSKKKQRVGRLRSHGARLATLAALLLLLASAQAATSTGPLASAESPTPGCGQVEEFDPANFSNPTNIDNELYPLIPGTQTTLEGSADGLPHRVVFIVTDLTKVINGVRSAVIWDTDYSGGLVAETELAFRAQDDDGNVWHMGEYPEEYEAGVLAGAPSTWIPGQADAESGVIMPGDPRVGTGYYVQGWAPDVDFLDCGKVFKTNEKACVPVDCYEDVLITDERAPLAPSEGHQRKFYAPGVGNFKIGATGRAAGEALELVEIKLLNPAELMAARVGALELEQRAYQISDVYAATGPAEWD